jgi:hypothetical protein
VSAQEQEQPGVMTSDALFWSRHSQPAFQRAFMRGVDAARAGRALGDNPYRRVHGSARARLGSWTESYTSAWASGWRHHNRGRSADGRA